MNESESSTYQAVRIGDTAEWRLIVMISERGMAAWLKHQNPTTELVTLFDERWTPDSDSLLSKIEAAVYDHPQVLDDFSANIAIVAPKALWVPTELAEADEDDGVGYYTRIYPAQEADVMTDEAGEATCMYTLTSGLNAFLKRTFPGAQVENHLSIMRRRFRERGDEMPRVYVDIREGEADYVVFDNTRFIMAATHPWHSPTDIEYHLFNIMDVYGLEPSKTQVSLSGLRDLKTDLMTELRKSLKYVMLTMLPSIGQKAGMPLAASLLLRNQA